MDFLLAHDSHPSNEMGPWFVKFVGYGQWHTARRLKPGEVLQSNEIRGIFKSIPASSRQELYMLADFPSRWYEHAIEWYTNLPSATKRVLNVFYHKNHGLTRFPTIVYGLRPSNNLGINDEGTIPIDRNHSSDAEMESPGLVESAAHPDNPDVLRSVEEGGFEFMNLFVAGNHSDEYLRNWLSSMYFSGTLTKDGWSSHLDLPPAAEQAAERIFDSMSPSVMAQLEGIKAVFLSGTPHQELMIDWWDNYASTETKQAIKACVIIMDELRATSGASFDALSVETLGTTMAAGLNDQNSGASEIGAQGSETTPIESASESLTDLSESIQTAAEVRAALENLTTLAQTTQALNEAKLTIIHNEVEPVTDSIDILIRLGLENTDEVRRLVKNLLYGLELSGG